MAADRGNTRLGRRKPKRRGVWDYNIPVPPIEQLCGGSFPFWCLIVFKEINNKLVEFLVVKPIVMDHPMCGIVEGEMELGQSVS